MQVWGCDDTRSYILLFSFLCTFELSSGDFP